jgi:hypothetical protein
LKLIAYNKWLEDLLKSQRYNKLYIPK